MIGRFIQADTIVPSPANPQSLNRYSYALNNPVRYNDPSGHCPMCIGAVIGVVAGGIIGAGVIAVPQMIKNYQNGQPLTTNIDPVEVGKAALIGAAAGAVVGGTLGLGLAAAGVVGGSTAGGAAVAETAATIGTTAAGAAGTASTAGTAVCADGDCTNEVNAAVQTVQSATQTTNQLLNAIRSIKFDPTQLQTKFKHAADFGVNGNYSKDNAAKFLEALQNHVNGATTQIIQGTYRGTQSVLHYFDPQTGRNVITDLNNNFISAWQLSAKQIEYLLQTGNVQ